jgi:hypothetical protein
MVFTRNGSVTHSHDGPILSQKTHASLNVRYVRSKMNRDAKAELNRRSQVCDALAGTGVRVANK